MTSIFPNWGGQLAASQLRPIALYRASHPVTINVWTLKDMPYILLMGIVIMLCYSWLCHSFLGQVTLTSQCLSFLICQMGIMTPRLVHCFNTYNYKS